MKIRIEHAPSDPESVHRDLETLRMDRAAFAAASLRRHRFVLSAFLLGMSGIVLAAGLCVGAVAFGGKKPFRRVAGVERPFLAVISLQSGAAIVAGLFALRRVRGAARLPEEQAHRNGEDRS